MLTFALIGFVILVALLALRDVSFEGEGNPSPVAQHRAEAAAAVATASLV